MKILLLLLTVAGIGVSAGYFQELRDWASATKVGRYALEYAGLSPETARPAQFLTAPVSIGHVRRTISAAGSLQAVATVEVSSQLSGQIAELHTDFNDRVARDQPLASLDQRGFKARIIQAEAAVDMAHELIKIRAAQLQGAHGEENEAIARRKIISSQIEQAMVSRQTAKRRLDRTAKLASRGTVAKAALEDERDLYKAATAKLREIQAVAAAHEHVISARTAGRQEAEAELLNAKAALPEKTAALALAKLDLSRSTIRSPIDGVIVGRNVEQGQTVAVSLEAPTLFMIAGDLSQMEIHANIDETDIGEIQIGQNAAFTVDAFPSRAFSAQVSEIRKAAKFVQGVVTYTVVLQTQNTDGVLLPGMTSTVRIVVEDVGPVRTVPLAALRFTPTIGQDLRAITGARNQSDTENDTVWTVGSDGTAQPIKVVLGPDDGRDIAILDGLQDVADHVIVGRAPPPVANQLFGIKF